MLHDHWRSVRRAFTFGKYGEGSLFASHDEGERGFYSGVNLLLEVALKGTSCEQLILALFVLAYNRWRKDLETEGGGCVSIGVGFCFKMPNVLNRFLLVLKDRLLTVFNEEVGGDVTVIREYRGIACGLRIVMRKREEYIEELKDLGDRKGVAETVRFMEGLQTDDMDRCNRTLLLMMEVEIKAREKSRFILKLSGYEEAAKEDRQIATKLNRLSEELLVLCEKRRNIVHKLRIFRSIVFVSKAAEFVAESVRKANDQAAQVRKVETEIEATVLEKEVSVLCQITGLWCLFVDLGFIFNVVMCCLFMFCKMSGLGVECDCSVVLTNMAYAGMSLLQELVRAADSNDIKDQLSVLFKREFDEPHNIQNVHHALGATDCFLLWYLLRDLFAKGGLDSIVVAMTELSSFVGYCSKERRGMVDVIVSVTVSMTSVGGVLVEECVP
nr:hypothetical protein [Tanacetum cinerariifolium]